MFGSLVALAGAVTVRGLLATLWFRHEELDHDPKLQEEDKAGAQALIAAVGAKRAGIKRRNKIKIPRQNDNPWDGRDALVDIQPPLIAECLIELSAGSPQVS